MRIPLILFPILAASCVSGCGSDGDERSEGRVENVLFVVIDTLRADRLQPYGYDRATSPVLDEFARESVVFDRAQSSSSWTMPALASLMTGLHTSTHKVDDKTSALDPSYTTLAEVLSEAGYATGAVTGNMFTLPHYGFGQGFSTYHQVLDSKSTERRDRRTWRFNSITSPEITKLALRWLKNRAEDPRPWFFWVHYFDPHSTYMAHAGTEHFGHEETDRYDGEIEFTDRHVGRLLKQLDEQGLAQSTAVIVLSDHGEELGDHGDKHHRRTLYREVLRVPLMIRTPGIPPKRVPDVVAIVDVMPTVLELLGESRVGGLHGRSLVPLLDGEPLPPVSAVAELLDIEGGRQYSIVRDRWKLIVHDEGETQLFDMQDDPEERSDLAKARPGLVVELQEELNARLSEARTDAGKYGVAADVELSDRELKELRQLGYGGD